MFSRIPIGLNRTVYQICSVCNNITGKIIVSNFAPCRFENDVIFRLILFFCAVKSNYKNCTFPYFFTQLNVYSAYITHCFILKDAQNVEIIYYLFYLLKIHLYLKQCISICMRQLFAEG